MLIDSWGYTDLGSGVWWVSAIRFHPDNPLIWHAAVEGPPPGKFMISGLLYGLAEIRTRPHPYPGPPDVDN